jgi:hypothetical protein
VRAELLRVLGRHHRRDDVALPKWSLLVSDGHVLRARGDKDAQLRAAAVKAIRGGREDVRMRRGGLLIVLVLASGCEPIPAAQAQRWGSPVQVYTERCQRLFEDLKYTEAEQACIAALRRDAS